MLTKFNQLLNSGPVNSYLFFRKKNHIFIPVIIQLKNYLESHPYPRTQMLTNNYWYYFGLIYWKAFFFFFYPIPRKILKSSVRIKHVFKILEVVLTQELEYRTRNVCHGQTVRALHWGDAFSNELTWMATDIENGVFLVKLNEAFQCVFKFSKSLIFRKNIRR